MLLVGFDGVALPDEVRRLAERGVLAGVVLFARNIVDLAQWSTLVDEMGDAFAGDIARGLAPIVAVDQEGGPVQRLKPPALPATVVPAMGVLGALADEGALDEADFAALGAAMGAEMRALGVNLDFAPVLDVDTNPDNPVIGRRAFGRTPEVVAARGLAWARGLASAGVAWCAKHFPGHGDTHLDSHAALPRLVHARARLEAIELAPFRAAVAAKAPMVMTAHVVFEALDATTPATLSRDVVPRLLRAAWGYDGVVVSDDLDMRAIRDHCDVDAVAAGLVEADVDLAMVCRDLAFAEALSDAWRPGPRARVRVEALRRTLAVPRVGVMPPWSGPGSVAEIVAGVANAG